LPFAAVEGDTP
jgi:hypothetical protein